jgi:hypothetical protein
MRRRHAEREHDSPSISFSLQLTRGWRRFFAIKCAALTPDGDDGSPSKERGKARNTRNQGS